MLRLLNKFIQIFIDFFKLIKFFQYLNTFFKEKYLGTFINLLKYIIIKIIFFIPFKFSTLLIYYIYKFLYNFISALMLLIGKFVYKSSQILFIFIFYYLIFLTICIIVCQYTINDFILVTEIDSLFNEKIMLKLDRLDKNDISTYNGYGWFNFREFNNFFEIFFFNNYFVFNFHKSEFLKLFQNEILHDPINEITTTFLYKMIINIRIFFYFMVNYLVVFDFLIVSLKYMCFLFLIFLSNLNFIDINKVCVLIILLNDNSYFDVAALLRSFLITFLNYFFDNLIINIFYFYQLLDLSAGVSITNKKLIYTYQDFNVLPAVETLSSWLIATRYEEFFFYINRETTIDTYLVGHDRTEFFVEGTPFFQRYYDTEDMFEPFIESESDLNFFLFKIKEVSYFSKKYFLVNTCDDFMTTKNDVENELIFYENLFLFRPEPDTPGFASFYDFSNYVNDTNLDPIWLMSVGNYDDIPYPSLEIREMVVNNGQNDLIYGSYTSCIYIYIYSVFNLIYLYVFNLISLFFNINFISVIFIGILFSLIIFIIYRNLLFFNKIFLLNKKKKNFILSINLNTLYDKYVIINNATNDILYFWLMSRKFNSYTEVKYLEVFSIIIKNSKTVVFEIFYFCKRIITFFYLLVFKYLIIINLYIYKFIIIKYLSVLLNKIKHLFTIKHIINKNNINFFYTCIKIKLIKYLLFFVKNSLIFFILLLFYFLNKIIFDISGNELLTTWPTYISLLIICFILLVLSINMNEKNSNALLGSSPNDPGGLYFETFDDFIITEDFEDKNDVDGGEYEEDEIEYESESFNETFSTLEKEEYGLVTDLSSNDNELLLLQRFDSFYASVVPNSFFQTVTLVFQSSLNFLLLLLMNPPKNYDTLILYYYRYIMQSLQADFENDPDPSWSISSDYIKYYIINKSSTFTKFSPKELKMLLIISEHEHLDYESFVENEWFNDFFFDNIYSQSIYDNDMSITLSKSIFRDFVIFDEQRLQNLIFVNNNEFFLNFRKVGDFNQLNNMEDPDYSDVDTDHDLLLDMNYDEFFHDHYIGFQLNYSVINDYYLMYFNKNNLLILLNPYECYDNKYKREFFENWYVYKKILRLKFLPFLTHFEYTQLLFLLNCTENEWDKIDQTFSKFDIKFPFYEISIFIFLAFNFFLVDNFDDNFAFVNCEMEFLANEETSDDFDYFKPIEPVFITLEFFENLETFIFNFKKVINHDFNNTLYDQINEKLTFFLSLDDYSKLTREEQYIAVSYIHECTEQPVFLYFSYFYLYVYQICLNLLFNVIGYNYFFLADENHYNQIFFDFNNFIERYVLNSPIEFWIKDDVTLIIQLMVCYHEFSFINLHEQLLNFEYNVISFLQFNIVFYYNFYIDNSSFFKNITDFVQLFITRALNGYLLYDFFNFYLLIHDFISKIFMK